MMVYSLFFAFLVLGSFLLYRTNERNVYLFLIFFFLLLIIGLRDISVGADTLSYVEDYWSISKMSLSEMVEYAFQTREPLFVIVSWLPSALSLNYSCYLLLWALFPVCSLYSIYKKTLIDSKDYLIATIVFFLLGFFAFFVAGIRQTAAISIVMSAAIHMNRVFIQSTNFFGKIKAIFVYLLFVGIAYLIHNSAIIAILAIPCLLITIRWWFVPIVLIVLFSARNLIGIGDIVVLSELFFNDRFANYGTIYESSQNMSGFVMQLILFIVCLSVKDILIKNDKQNSFLFAMMLAGLLIQSLSPLLAEMARISYYFAIFGVVLTPRALKLYPNKIRKLVYFGFVTVSLVYLFFLTKSNLPDYHSTISFL